MTRPTTVQVLQNTATALLAAAMPENLRRAFSGNRGSTVAVLHGLLPLVKAL